MSRPQAHADPGKATRPQPRDVGRALHGGTPRQGGAARACRASNWLTVGPTVLPLANGPRCAGKPVANTGWQNRSRPRPLSWPHRDWAPPAGRSRGYAAGSSGLEPRAPEAAQPLGAFVQSWTCCFALGELRSSNRGVGKSPRRHGGDQAGSPGKDLAQGGRVFSAHHPWFLTDREGDGWRWWSLPFHPKRRTWPQPVGCGRCRMSRYWSS